ncbi:ABC transporter substrate-binding protein [Nocardioides humi]|uniref:Leucine-binding protein domain-containing protein n=1 Tax=Nocardioides humi TaxID=449461 RepID=A0ABN2A6R8_9ACTN|nr:ABC transporter substrate-binding protein [Nocardioides humi]
MKHIVRRAAIGACALSLASGLTACADSSDEAGGDDDVITIAVVADRTGGLAFFGERAQQGWDLALEAIDAEIAGHKVEYVEVQCDTPANCGADTTRVINEKGVDIVMGTPGSALALAIAEAAARAEVPYFETASLVNTLLPDGEAEYIFRGAMDETQLNAGVRPALEAWYDALGEDVAGKTAVVVNESSAANHNAAELQKSILDEMGVEVLDQFEYEVDSTDFAPLAARVKQADADIVLETSYVADMIALNTELSRVKLDPEVHVIVGAPSPTEQAEALGADYLEGVVHVTFPSLDVNEEGAQGIDEFLSAYREEFGEDPDSSYALTYYSSARILFAVLELADGATDAESFREAIAQIDEPTGSFANGWGAKFDERGQNQNAAPDTVQWQGGQVCTVLPAEAAACELEVG